MTNKYKFYTVATEDNLVPHEDTNFDNLEEAINEAKELSKDPPEEESVIVYECTVRAIRKVTYQPPKVEVIK